MSRVRLLRTISLPICDAHTWAAYRVSKATRGIALAQYEKAIQTAFRDVADTWYRIYACRIIPLQRARRRAASAG